jgi:alpha-D-xyloside xylohydrolase
MNVKGAYEGQSQTNDTQRVYILTRSALGGQQRYAATTWGSNLAATWYGLKAQISNGVNFTIFGILYWSMDIGAFVPIFRVHGQFPHREMYNVALDNHPAYQSMLAYDKLRYRLIPYIYSSTGMVTQQDYTIMRGLVMNFGSDKNVLNINDQYMFGPVLLINPVTKYKSRTRSLYLPSGTGWYDLQSGRSYKGGQTIQQMHHKLKFLCL